MSGHRWSSISCLSLLVMLSGCQTDGSSRFAWNPFAKKPNAVAAEESKSSFSLPKFSRRNEDKSEENNAVARSPMAVEQLDRLLEQGQVALQDNRLDDAKKAYVEVIESAPDNATAHHGLAMVADLSEQWSDAEYHYRQALRIRPQDANLLCDIGYSYLLQNRYSEASRYLNHAVEINPNHESAQMNLAMLDLRQGNRAGASERILQRYGSSAKASQILAQLEAQSGVVTEKVATEPATIIPANATFEQIQEIARRERIEAERKRVMSGVPQDHANSAGFNSNASVLSNDNAVSRTEVGRPVMQSPSWNDSTTRTASVAPGPGNTVSAPVPAGGVAQNPPQWANISNANAGQPSYQPTPANSSSSVDNQINPNAPTASFSGVASSNGAGVNGPAMNGLVSGSQPAMNANTYGQNPVGVPGHPSSVNSAFGNPVAGNATGLASGGNSSLSTVQYPIAGGPGMNGTAASNGTNPSAGVSNGSGNGPAPGTGTGLGRVTSIYPSGNFQPQSTGSTSYGQPVGFSSSSGQPPVSTANGSNALSICQPNVPQSNGAQNGMNGNAVPQMNLEGLNVGPGSLFPIGQPNAAQGQMQQTAPANGGFNGSSLGEGSLKMGNVSSPGANSMINGTMYPAAQSHLPSQQWMSQQQEQLALQSRQNGTASSNPGIGSAASNSNPNATAWPAMRPPQVNPLESYERQRQQLDNEYNKTLQQMDRQGQPSVPRAQY